MNAIMETIKRSGEAGETEAETRLAAIGLDYYRPEGVPLTGDAAEALAVRTIHPDWAVRGVGVIDVKNSTKHSHNSGNRSDTIEAILRLSFIPGRNAIMLTGVQRSESHIAAFRYWGREHGVAVIQDIGDLERWARGS
jgi:hypothetical protein